MVIPMRCLNDGIECFLSSVILFSKTANNSSENRDYAGRIIFDQTLASEFHSFIMMNFVDRISMVCGYEGSDIKLYILKNHSHFTLSFRGCDDPLMLAQTYLSSGALVFLDFEMSYLMKGFSRLELNEKVN